MISLTVPPPDPPDGLADPITPAWDQSTGFTPDAVRVLTVLSLQVSLEHYRDVHGAYPERLESLFPADAPTGEDGRPLAGPPPGYLYRGGGATYELSVALDSGMPYAVTATTR